MVGTGVDTRQAILDATWDLLVERGHGEFGLEVVAKRAKVSRQTVYAHFASRADLLVAVVEGYKQRVGYDRLIAPVLAAPTAIDALRELVRFYVQFTPAIIGPSLALDAERARDPELEKTFGARDSGRHQMVHHVVTRLAAEGVLADGWTVPEAADLISACTSAGFAVELLRRRDWTIDDLASALQRLFLTAFVVPPTAHEPKGDPT